MIDSLLGLNARSGGNFVAFLFKFAAFDFWTVFAFAFVMMIMVAIIIFFENGFDGPSIDSAIAIIHNSNRVTIDNIFDFTTNDIAAFPLFYEWR